MIPPFLLLPHRVPTVGTRVFSWRNEMHKKLSGGAEAKCLRRSEESLLIVLWSSAQQQVLISQLIRISDFNVLNISGESDVVRLDVKIGVGQSLVETACTSMTARHFSDPSRGKYIWYPFRIFFLPILACASDVAVVFSFGVYTSVDCKSSQTKHKCSYAVHL